MTSTPPAPPPSSSPIQPGGALHFGLTGLAVMGQNLARNIASHGFPIAVHNRTTAKTDEFIAAHGAEGAFTAADEVERVRRRARRDHAPS